MRLVWPILLIVTALVLLILLITSDAKAHYQPGTHNAVHAIQLAFCGKANRECFVGNQAITVAKCESSYYWSQGIPHLAVGPKDEHGIPRKGMFQFGSSERKEFGYGPDPWSQAWATRRMYRQSISDYGDGWHRFACKP